MRCLKQKDTILQVPHTHHVFISIFVFVAHKQINVDTQETNAVQNVLLVDRFLWLLAFNKTRGERKRWNRNNYNSISSKFSCETINLEKMKYYPINNYNVMRWWCVCCVVLQTRIKQGNRSEKKMAKNKYSLFKIITFIINPNSNFYY